MLRDVVSIEWNNAPDELSKKLFIHGLKQAIHEIENGNVECGELKAEININGIKETFTGWWSCQIFE